MACKCSGVRALFLLGVLCSLLPFSVFAQKRPKTNILPETSYETRRKLEWLDKYGTPIRVGMDRAPNLSRHTEFACRKGRYDLVRKDWGLAKTKINSELVPCPDFF